MIFLYRLITSLLYPLFIILIFFRKKFKKEHPTRFKEKIFSSHFQVKRNKISKLLWFHASSIGELKSILPIIEQLNKKNKNLEFLLTTVTVSSENIAKDFVDNFKNVQHRFFPIDVSFLINKFLDSWRPDYIFLVDSEIWPNLILSTKKRGIPLALINARITKKTFNRWMLFPNFTKTIFGKFNLCLSSNQESDSYLQQLGAKNIYYTGNLKLLKNDSTKNYNHLNKDLLRKNKIWFALSTHNGEERMCLQVHLNLKNKFKNIITIIAPRHVDRVKKIKNLCDKYNLSTQIIEKEDQILENKEIIIINHYGDLDKYLTHALSVFIGKSTLKELEKVGGQSPIEAVNLGCKIYHGPYVYNFKEIYETLKKNNISKEINSDKELSEYLKIDLEEKVKDKDKFKNLMNSLRVETLNKVMKNLEEFISNENQ